MKILSFDQSLTASAVVTLATDELGKKLHLSQADVYKPKSTGIARLIGFKAWAMRHIERTEPGVVVRELHNQRTYGAAGAIVGLAALLDEMAWERSYLDHNNYFMIPPTSWKKCVLRKGNFAKDTAYLMHVNNFLAKSPWFHLGHEVIEDDNIADAICLGICAYLVKMVNTNHINPEDLPQYERDVIKKSEAFCDYGKSG